MGRLAHGGCTAGQPARRMDRTPPAGPLDVPARAAVRSLKSGLQARRGWPGTEKKGPRQDAQAAPGIRSRTHPSTTHHARRRLRPADGRATLPGNSTGATRVKHEPKPWGIAAHTWQAFAFALAGLLAITNAAWFYTVRVARAEAAAPPPEPRRTERVIYQTPDGRTVPAPTPRPAPAAAPRRVERPAPLAADEECVGTTRFRRSGNTWTNVGRC